MSAYSDESAASMTPQRVHDLGMALDCSGIDLDARIVLSFVCSAWHRLMRPEFRTSGPASLSDYLQRACRLGWIGGIRRLSADSSPLRHRADVIAALMDCPEADVPNIAAMLIAYHPLATRCTRENALDSSDAGCCVGVSIANSGSMGDIPETTLTEDHRKYYRFVRDLMAAPLCRKMALLECVRARQAPVDLRWADSVRSYDGSGYIAIPDRPKPRTIADAVVELGYAWRYLDERRKVRARVQYYELADEPRVYLSRLIRGNGAWMVLDGTRVVVAVDAEPLPPSIPVYLAASDASRYQVMRIVRVAPPGEDRVVVEVSL